MRISWATTFSIEVHALLAVLFIGPRVHARSAPPPTTTGTELVDVTTAEQPAAPIPVHVGAGAPGPRRAAPRTVRAPASPPPEPVPPGEPPPPAAQAGEALTVEHAEDSIVRDAHEGYAGGVTQEKATSLVPTYDPSARAWGVPGGTGVGGGGGGGGENLSRGARLGGPKYWACPFPPEADGIDHAVVRVQADVRADGTPVSVTVLDDPGHGFGREALPCAMKERYISALDRDGRPVRAVTLPFRVVFDR